LRSYRWWMMRSVSKMFAITSRYILPAASTK
jgi:hypothetical protein